MNELKQLLLQGAQQLEILMDSAKADQFISYLELLLRWNKSFNLTAITEPKQIVIKHFLDSIAVAPYVSGNEILDVGAGAGLPGIPLALLYPDKQFVLLDSNGKKTRFVQQVIAQLSLENAKVINERVENYHPDKKFDQIYSRAFTSLVEKCVSAAHLLKSDGRIMAMKGLIPEDELLRIPPEFIVVATHSLKVPGLLNEERHLIEIGHRQ